MSGELYRLLRQAKGYEMTPEEENEQRISWVTGNVGIHNPNVTKDLVREVAEDMEK